MMMMMMKMMRKDRKRRRREGDHVVEDGPSPKRKKMEAPEAMHEDKEVEKGAMHDNMKSDGKEEQEEAGRAGRRRRRDEGKAAKSDEAGGTSALTRHDQQVILTWLHRRTSAKKCTPAAKEEALGAVGRKVDFFGTTERITKLIREARPGFNHWKDSNKHLSRRQRTPPTG